MRDFGREIQYQDQRPSQGQRSAQSVQGWHINCWLGTTWGNPQHKVYVQVVKNRKVKPAYARAFL